MHIPQFYFKLITVSIVTVTLILGILVPNGECFVTISLAISSSNLILCKAHHLEWLDLQTFFWFSVSNSMFQSWNLDHFIIIIYYTYMNIYSSITLFKNKFLMLFLFQFISWVCFGNNWCHIGVAHMLHPPSSDVHSSYGNGSIEQEVTGAGESLFSSIMLDTNPIPVLHETSVLWNHKHEQCNVLE